MTIIDIEQYLSPCPLPILLFLAPSYRVKYPLPRTHPRDERAKDPALETVPRGLRLGQNS